jgi:hypothetical protein
MPIYTRDNINYGGMLGNAMANRANYLQRRYDRVAQMGQNWGNAIQQSGQAIQNAFNQAAQYQYNKDQLANQQQFQAEQAALNRAQQLNMAREQQKFQEQQNALNRQNTYDIAELNRQTSFEERNAEKQAQAIMHYDVQKGILNSIADEIMRTDDPSKLAQLYRQRDEAAAKLNYYAPMVPEAYKGQRYGESFPGFQMGMGQDRTLQAPVVAEVPADTRQQSVRYADFVSQGKSATTSKDVDAALANIATVDTSKLTTAQKEAYEKDKNELTAKAAQLRKQEAFAAKVKNWKPGDEIPAGYEINFVNGQIAGLKKKK